ncbi:uncharacterized protein KGF55_004927 [Candida pseudojiufengensis]|uniref:uncharacterized protein n=1 Tax=Candida pseudojiufengensis TaxID=497109 RepID=UPI00222583E8|nr:uncharacterized protein KGF55_004927 [Candida pseudojiufengensis]KAI5960204.1 hypothetical protein KGF55_004927 [Candida pseudojiufengensis]
MFNKSIVYPQYTSIDAIMSSVTIDDENYWHPTYYSYNAISKNSKDISNNSENYNIMDKLMIPRSIKLKELKLIPAPLPALHHHNYDTFVINNSKCIWLKELETQYQYLESLAAKVVENICIVIKHAWKYNKELHAEYAQQFLILFKSIFDEIKPIDCSLQIQRVLIKIYDDVYFNRYVQNIINNLFLGLDNSNLRLLILGLLIEEYHYLLPEFEFVLGICSLGLEIMRIKLFETSPLKNISGIYSDIYSNYNLNFNLKDKIKNKDWKPSRRIVKFTKVSSIK